VSKVKIEKQSGFTITELLIAVSLASIISIAMLSLLVFAYGSLLREQTKASMISESQLFLRRIVEDIRIASEIRTTNQIPDSYRTEGWVTSDPANIMILTSLAADSDKNFIYDPTTSYPYENEIIYFGDGRNMYRRTLANESAAGNSVATTCTFGLTGCRNDIKLSENLQNMTFVFYDLDNVVTTDASQAQSVSISINLTRSLYGKTVSVTNVARTTLRNEN
jgi:prepilin-type N-terminal cleavage/methylation domain-containing protein